MVGSVSDDELEKLADLITERILARMNQAERMVTIDELARASSLSQSTLFRLMKREKLTAVKVGGALRFNLQRALAELAVVSKEAK